MVEMLVSEFEQACQSIESKMSSAGLDNLDSSNVKHRRYHQALQVIKDQAEIKNPKDSYEKRKIEVKSLSTKDSQNPLPFPVSFDELKQTYLR